MPSYATLLHHESHHVRVHCMCDIHVVDTPTECDHAKRMALAGMDIGEFVGVCMVSDGQ